MVCACVRAWRMPDGRGRTEHGTRRLCAAAGIRAGTLSPRQESGDPGPPQPGWRSLPDSALSGADRFEADVAADAAARDVGAGAGGEPRMAAGDVWQLRPEPVL